MKANHKKTTARSENFNCLQALRGAIKETFDVSNVKWGGHWNGKNWENFSFYCTKQSLDKIKTFCTFNEIQIKFS